MGSVGASRAARWGLLVTSALLSVALLYSVVASSRDSVEAAAAMTRGQALDLAAAVRRAVRVQGWPSQDVLNEVVADLEEQGLRFLALMDGAGRVLLQAGTPAAPLDSVAAGLPRRTQEVVPVGALGLARTLAPLSTGRPRKRLQQSLRPFQRWPARQPHLVLDFEPRDAALFARRARQTLVVGVAGALVLLGAALVFWRMSLREEQNAARLAEDRQLKRLGEMSAVLGHEVRNPLTALKGHAQLVVERLDGHPARRSAEQVVREALRLEELAAQILDFARTGKIESSPQEPAAVVARALAAVDSPLALLVPGPSAPPASWPLDGPKMEQVIVNLVRNALQAGPEGSPVDVTLGAEAGALVLEVRDRGPGVAPEDQARIFEPFFTTRARGTGLGLTIARQVVEGHGGTVTVSNHPEGGAVFRVTIPGSSSCRAC